MEARIQAAAQLLAQADGLLIGAGAGMGVDSGLPDFRGNTGFWKAYPALAQARMQFDEIANPESFDATPRLAWGFYGHRLQLYRDTLPHEGFGILQEFAAKLPHGAFVFTSNVDGQFQKAGFDASRIVECHGSIHHLQCGQPCSRHVWSASGLIVDVDADNCLLRSELPRCPNCGGLARPNILMFNDMQWLEGRSAAQRGLLNSWIKGVERLIVIELGAGTHIPSVRSAGESLRVPLIRINPTEAGVRAAQDVGLQVGALDGLRLLAAAVKEFGK